MYPTEVIERVADMSIWKNAVWVNTEHKLFYVPIWRNGNTTFMNQVAEKQGFTLEQNYDLTGYTGFAFIRHPLKRIVGQVWRATVNHGYTINYVMDNLVNDIAIDDHMFTQLSFLKNYDINYYIDLDNLKFLGINAIDNIIREYIKIPSDGKHDSQRDQNHETMILDVLQKNMHYRNAIENYYKDDFELYYNAVSKPEVGIIGTGKIGAVLQRLLENNKIRTAGYDISRLSDTFERTISADLIWICVDTPTPSWGDTVDDQPADYDISKVKAVLNAIGPGRTVILGSTVSPGTVRSLNYNGNLYYMPFLISQGIVEQGLVRPDIWFVGTAGDNANIILDLLSKFSTTADRAVVGTYEEVELAKVLYNAWVIQKINFANWAGDLSRAVGNANSQKLMSWLANCKTIVGPSYMKPGWGDGGPCHPRDNLALSWLNNKLNLGYDPALNQHNTRLAQAKLVADEAESSKLPVCILGRSYKPNILDTTGSYSLLVADLLEKRNITVCYEDTDTSEKDYCYILAHNDWYNHTPTPNSYIINPWNR